MNIESNPYICTLLLVHDDQVKKSGKEKASLLACVNHIKIIAYFRKNDCFVFKGLVKTIKIQQILQEQALPESFIETINNWYLPLATAIAKRFAKESKGSVNNTRMLGIQGCQGSGKSTLAHFLAALLAQNFNLSCCVLSIDDFYFSKSKRLELAKTVHPLFATRGVPGTHDTELAMSTFSALLQPRQDYKPVLLPRFNKALDDLEDKKLWPEQREKVDVIIFEGWFVGAPAESEQALIEPVNAFEREQDPDGTWRRLVNMKLAEEYQSLFKLIDYLIVLEAPSFDSVYEWRLLQEQKLASNWLKNTKKDHNKEQGSRIMNEKQLRDFIAYYERITRHCLRTMPEKADCLFKLNPSHEIIESIYKQ